ncbi:MAG TPA: ABC transporter permease subunit [Dehalococcoidia bacterium]|nr:ABC transporter permease subunit [Dehalococcoidia bacterium]
MNRLMAVEFFKLRKRMMTWIVAVILVGLVILLYSLLWNISGHDRTFGEHRQFTSQDLRRALFLQSAVPFSLSVVSSFGVILAVVLAAGAAGSEYSWGTVRLMATASSGRIRLIAARLIVVFALVTAGTLLAVAVGVAYSSVITFTSGGADFHFVTASFLRDQLASLARTLFVVSPYVAIAFAMAVVGRSTMTGVGSALGLAIMEPLVSALMREAGGFWQDIPRFFINSNLQVILLENKLPDVVPRFGPSPEELAARHENSPDVAALVLAAYVIIFIGLAFYVYRRRDITAS